MGATVVKPEERIPLLKRLIQNFNIQLLYWDLESSPNLGYFWSTGEQYMSYKQIKKDHETKVITIQFMWENEKEAKYLVWDKKDNIFSDKAIIEYFITKVLRKYSSENLVIIGQNHKAFDHKLLNERAKVLRLTPPLHDVVKVDTYTSSKQSFKTASHSLDARSKQYKLGGKLETDLSTWTDILEGKREPTDIMVPYGLKDVVDLRTVFWNDLPYYEKLPAKLERLLLKAKTRCVKCEERKHCKYDLEECKIKGKKGWLCINCGDKFV